MLDNASYSTCSPSANTWRLRGSKVTLDKAVGRGSVVNSVLYVRNVPVFYFPYMSFPLDKRRKSGFSFPTFAYANDTGPDITLPYYFNLAPNYDLTVKARDAGRRGFIAEECFAI